jgi:CRISPR-associated protein Csx14
VPDDCLSVRLDPLNPGQFFACCGLFELLGIEEPGLLSSFAVDPLPPRVASFSLHSQNGPPALSRILNPLRVASVAFEPSGKEPVRPATIRFGETCLELDWWLDNFREETTNLKCWAGQVTTRRLFTELLPLLDVASSPEDLFDRAVSTSSLFGVDPRSAWNTLDLGFSPNEHNVASTVFPAVEVLAAIGLQYFRPESGDRSAVRYSLWRDRLPASVARLAFRAPWDGLKTLDLKFEICKRGQSYKYFSFAGNAERRDSI